MGRLFGIPKSWNTLDDLKGSELGELLGDVTVDIWIKKGGEGVGIATVQFESVQARRDAVNNLRTKSLRSQAKAEEAAERLQKAVATGQDDFAASNTVSGGLDIRCRNLFPAAETSRMSMSETSM